MNNKQTIKFFEILIKEAEKILFEFTLSRKLSINKKADKTVVTKCDEEIDKKLTKICNSNGFKVVSEEGEKALDFVKSGNYITIDPIDGTLGYIDYVNYALENGGISNFLKKDLGSAHDFCLLLGIVENCMPMYGACFNFITKEKIIIDGKDKKNLIRLNNIRNYDGDDVVYIDQREGGEIEKELINLSKVKVIKQATVGLKSLYTIVNSHKNAVMYHGVQSSGLWDIMPALVATRAFEGEIFDDKGDKVVLDKYVILPGNGCTAIKGNRFEFVIERLKKRDLNTCL